MTLDVVDLKNILTNLDSIPEDTLLEIERLVDEIGARDQMTSVRSNLLDFCQYMQSDYIIGAHHRRLAALLENIEQGEKDRICVSVPPRHGKSQLVSIYYAAWYLGRHPDHKVMLVSHTGDLAVDFGRKIRNLIASPKYQKVFEGIALAHDSKSAGRWNTNHGGEFFAAGVGSALAGRGAHLLLVDDPHSEQDVLAGNFDTFEKVYQWFAFGARTRLMPGGKVAIIHTRWHMDDLIGRVIRDMTQNDDADQYEVFEFPAIREVPNPDYDPSIVVEKEEDRVPSTVEKALWPEFFDVPALRRTRASMPTYQWNAQYQQKPTAEEGSVIKREWWRIWLQDKPPRCEYIIMALDAAAESHNRADYTALTTWGVFVNEDEGVHNIILLNAIKKRMEFPELKAMARAEYNKIQPDAFIVEKKSSGSALYQELRRSGLPVQEYTPHRGTGDKMARLNSVADIVASGLCWVPTHRWAEEVVEEIAGFPYMSNDDLVDSTVMALLRFRQGGFVTLPSDGWGDDRDYEVAADYY